MVAGLLLSDVASNARLLASISGARGSGKTALLDALEARLVEAGIDVSRDPARITIRAGERRCAVLVDDAHELGETELTGIHDLVQERQVDLVVAYRTWPHPPALKRLTNTLEHHRAPVFLGSLPPAELEALAAAKLGGTPPAQLVDQLHRLTGGMPWLVQRVLSTVRPDARGLPSEPLASRAVTEQLAHEMEELDTGIHELLLALALGFDLSLRVPRSLAQSEDGIDTLVAKARAAGLLLADGTLIPLVRHTLLAATPPYRLRLLQRALVDTFAEEGVPLDHVARNLAESGLEDQRVARTLERSGDKALTAEPALAVTYYDDAIAAGADDVHTAARRAQAAWAVGDLDAAGRIVDELLTHDTPPDLQRAVDVDAAVWAGRGMLAQGAQLYRWLGPARVGESAPLAAVAMIAVGDAENARAMFDTAPESGSPTLLAVATALMGQGIRCSIEPLAADALPGLVRSSDLMTASGLTVPLPDTPAALAALVALHLGDLDTADAVLSAAIDGEQGGRVARQRLLLLAAWAAMQGDRLVDARTAILAATSDELPLAPRDELLLCALEVALARRADDGPALVRAWRKASERILHVPVDLFSLLPLGELVVAAARLQDSRRLETHIAEAWALLERLGNPPLWSIPLRWSAVQAAIIAERPGDLAPHAAALVRASTGSRLASVLSAAGRAWISVLAGDFRVATAESAAKGLASVGRRWDGARLAAHAAARATENKDVSRLLACARDLHPGNPGQASRQERTGTVTEPSTGADDAGLSAREREVARLVLEGKTYREIGEIIFVSPRTAEHHIARIRRRLGATTRSDLLAKLRAELEVPKRQNP